MSVILDNNSVWSFSRLELFHTCPYAFYLTHMQDPPLPQAQNAWAEFGTLCHSLLEEYGNGTLTAEMLVPEYKKRYPTEVIHQFPPVGKGNYGEKTYNEGLEYFSQFSGFGDEYDVVSTEEKFLIEVRGYKIAGISDLVLRNKETGKLIVVDHKTKGASSMRKDISTFKKQLYLYAEHVKQKYGEYPDELRFNMIRNKDTIAEKFSIDKLEEMKDWVEETIDIICLEDEFAPNPNMFYCRHICSMIEHCADGQEAFMRR